MKKRRGYLRSLERKQKVSGKRIVGIDPAKENHQAGVLDEQRMQKSVGSDLYLSVGSVMTNLSR